MQLIAVPVLLLIMCCICFLGMYFWVWPSVDSIKKNSEENGTVKAIFSWDLFFILLKVLALAALNAIILVVAVYFLVRPVFDFLCGNYWLQIVLGIAPIILEIVGIVLSVVGVGIPIVGIGMFLEVITIICDGIYGDWISVFLGVAGLIPLGGLPFGIGRSVRRLL